MSSAPEAFAYRRGELFAEDVPLAAIAARVGTPCYVYSRSMIETRWRAFDEAFGDWPHLVCYAVKACPNLGVLSVLARLGSGFDIVSVGELERVLRAGGNPSKLIFSGVGKSQAEMRRALQVGVHCFNVESAAELELLNETAGASKACAQIALRVNPDVDPNTHPYIATGLKENKFGVPIDAAVSLYARARSLPHVRVVGVACHIGSQLVTLSPFVDALERVLVLIDRLRAQGIPIADLDLGGGLGIRYRDDTPPDPRTYVDTLLKRLQARRVRVGEMRILIEPGRALVGEAGMLLTRVEYLKPGEAKSFAVVDAAVNDLLRPALYQAWHDIVPVASAPTGPARRYDVVGPVCESADFLGRDRELAIAAGDLLAIRAAGAYGASMSSRYNTRALTPEVIVDGERFHVVRRRENIDEILATESTLPE